MMASLVLLLPTAASALSLPPAPCFTDQAAYYLSSSRGVRASRNGLTFLSRPVQHPPGSAPCARAPGMLCALGANYTFLPCTALPSTFAEGAVPPFERLWLLLDAPSSCGGKLPGARLDVLACDLQQDTASLLWGDGRISVVYDSDVPYWPRLAIALIMVWLVVNLGETVALLLDVPGSRPRNLVTAALCVVLVGLVFAYTPWESSWSTAEERGVYAFVLAYILAYSAYHLVNVNTINVIVGCLLLVTSRYYQACETQYVTPFVFLVAARFFQKCHTARVVAGWKQAARLAFMAMDVALVVVEYVYGFEGSFPDAAQGPLCFTALVFVAWCTGRFMAGHHRQVRGAS